MLYLGYVSAYKFNAEKMSHLTTSHFFILFFLEIVTIWELKTKMIMATPNQI